MGRLYKDLILTANPGPWANELQYTTHKGRKRKRRHSEREEAKRRAWNSVPFCYGKKNTTKRVESMARKMLIITNNANNSLRVTVARWSIDSHLRLTLYRLDCETSPSPSVSILLGSSLRFLLCWLWLTADTSLM